jgi:flagellar protein FliS
MFARQQSSSLNAYRQNAAYGGVAAADPHQLVTLLYDGAIERIQKARGAMAAGERRTAAELISRSVDIVEELRAALRPQQDGAIAKNLGDLYEYCGRRLLMASLGQKPEPLEEVAGLLRELRTAWVSIQSSAGQLRTGS